MVWENCGSFLSDSGKPIVGWAKAFKAIIGSQPQGTGREQVLVTFQVSLGVPPARALLLLFSLRKS